MAFFEKEILKQAARRVAYSPILMRSVIGMLQNQIKVGKYRFSVESPRITDKTRMEIFYRRYEMNEIQLLRKYFRTPMDTIELGGSLGVLSCFAIEQAQGRHFITAEADPELFQVMYKNIKNNFPEKGVVMLNVGITGKSISEITFAIPLIGTQGGSVEGSLVSSPSLKQIVVKARRLSDILEEYNIGEYRLSCDIEGSEVSILIDDPNSLRNCRQIIIELHDCQYGDRKWTIAEIADLICRQGFRQQDQAGAVHVFERQH